ncbi:TPA: hypothetical protein ACSCYS_003500 [Aeromonas veronii]
MGDQERGGYGSSQHELICSISELGLPAQQKHRVIDAVLVWHLGEVSGSGMLILPIWFCSDSEKNSVSLCFLWLFFVFL